MTLWEAVQAERAASDAVLNRINEGVLPEDPKVPVLNLVQAYGRAVEQRKALEILTAVQGHVR